jgi:hypothetical protein
MTITTPQVAYHTDTGEIVRIATPVGLEPEDGEISSVCGNYVHRIYDFEGLDPASFLNTRRWDFINSEWVSCPERPNMYAFWNVEAAEWDWDSEQLKTELRHLRGILLSSSDWTQIADNTLTEAQRAEARTYRQALRDCINNLPSTIDSTESMVWPTKPDFL